MSYHEALLGLGLAALGFAIVIGLAVYIYSAWAIMTLAQKTKTDNAWLAWIPIANLFLVANIAGLPWWTALVVLLAGWIPFVGQIAAAAIVAWWFYEIAQKRNYEGWVGILMIIPFVNLVILGVLAFNDK